MLLKAAIGNFSEKKKYIFYMFKHVKFAKNVTML